jgi:ribonuclease T1
MALRPAQNLGSGLRFTDTWVTLAPLMFPGLPGYEVPASRPVRSSKISPEGPFMFRLAVSKFALTSAIVVAAITGAGVAQARGFMDDNGRGAVSVRVAELPRQGQETYERIRQGGPFPYDKDGTVFGNRERQLPIERRGYYREYTVSTPGSRDRGARRIVCGGPARTPHACYYTADHYNSFRKIVE